MSQININGDTSGTISLVAPAVAGSNTATFPAATGVVLVETALSASTTNTVYRPV